MESPASVARLSRTVLRTSTGAGASGVDSAGARTTWYPSHAPIVPPPSPPPSPLRTTFLNAKYPRSRPPGASVTNTELVPEPWYWWQ